MQGTDPQAAELLVADARALQDAGAFSIVLECVPAAVADRVTREVEVPTIGIGAGAACDGQVLVLHDLLGITPAQGQAPRFVKNFLAGRESVQEAVQAYVAEVKSGAFPAAEHEFS